jgi:hypothetical protein
MTNYIPPGAYIIHLKDTHLALRNARFDSAIVTPKDDKCVVLDSQNEIRSREAQIWWIERVPGYEDDEQEEEAGVYTITHTSSGRGLEVGRSSTPEAPKCYVRPGRGQPEQQWTLKRIIDDEDGLVT